MELTVLLRRVFYVCGMLGVLLHLGCNPNLGPRTFMHSNQFKGKIFISVTENTGTREVRQDYEILPAEGKVAPSSEQVAFVQNGNSGGIGSCSSSPDVISPDGKYIAKCDGPLPFVSHRGNPDRMIVTERSTGRVILRQPQWDQDTIKSFLWSPDSQAVAVLTSYESFGLGPGDLLSRLFGHPVPYNSYNVVMYQVSPNIGVIGTGPNAIVTGGEDRSVRGFSGDVRYGFATFLSWEIPKGDSKISRPHNGKE